MERDDDIKKSKEQPLIVLEDVSYKYEDGTTALDHVNLSLMNGISYCITGPNGSGKSSLFRIMNGLSFPTSGKYFFNGNLITDKYLKTKKNAFCFHKSIGYLFQDSEVQLFNRSVEDEISFGLYQMGLADDEITRRTEYYLNALSLTELRHRAPFNLSGGEKKRCALAAVLAMEPPVLMLDEPLSGLDENGERFVSDCIKKLKESGHLLITASHDSAFLWDIADHVIRIDALHHCSMDDCMDD